jgi:hypothetical protein
MKTGRNHSRFGVRHLINAALTEHLIIGGGGYPA